MPRKKCLRHVANHPEITIFKPVGIPMCDAEAVVLHVEEYEAIRLADLESLYQEEAAGRMGVSRATFGRIVAEARAKIADAIVNRKVIRIEGGNFEVKKNI